VLADFLVVLKPLKPPGFEVVCILTIPLFEVYALLPPVFEVLSEKLNHFALVVVKISLNFAIVLVALGKVDDCFLFRELDSALNYTP
jgi:hypothetical protein